MLHLTITIEAKNYSGVENSINEAKRWIMKEYKSGMNGNDDENYSFAVTGKEETEEEN